MNKLNQIKLIIDEKQCEKLKLLANINELSLSNYCQYIVLSFIDSIDISKLNDVPKSTLNPNSSLKLLE
ncbi:hypothetical protein [Bacillus sp. NPDC094077]|uniref:hypothetical protein n=1 Tax=Bacillus sp. NPDC094077 TaxID=3390932 RepID=UPI003D03F59A